MKAPKFMYCAPHPKNGWAIALAGDWPSPGNPNDTKYIRADLLEAHIGAVLEQAAECAYNLRREDWASEDEDWDAGTHDAAVAITALRPTALTALDRAKREARVEALEQAAAVAKEIANQYVGYMGRIERAIRALIEAERGKP